MKRRPSWATAPEARPLVLAAIAADPRLTPARVRLVVDVVDFAEGRRAATWCPAGPVALMARALVAQGYLAVAKEVTTGGVGLWAGPGPAAEALVGPLRALASFTGRKPPPGACPTCGAARSDSAGQAGGGAA